MGSILETTAAVAPGDDGARKARILAALTVYARQRPGFDPCNYGDRASYDADRRRALQQLHDVERIAAAVAWRSIGPDALLQAARGGGVTITERDDGTVAVDYCAGQYFCTEFRGGIARVLASALWDWTREYAMPKPTRHVQPEPRNAAIDGDGCGRAVIVDKYDGLHAGDWLRRYFAREFGRGMASRYFN